MSGRRIAGRGSGEQGAGLAKGDFCSLTPAGRTCGAGGGLCCGPEADDAPAQRGVAGLTAYFGLLECGQPKAGETVVVSAAAGSVGSLVGQIAKIRGCKVVGIAGGAEKCAWLKDELGFDEAVDYKAGDVRRALRAACPKGIDVYFDDVGGDVFEAALFNMNNFGRIACCGAVSQYDGSAPPHGPRGIPGLIVTKRLNVRLHRLRLQRSA